jgi:hypothetical protein
MKTLHKAFACALFAGVANLLFADAPQWWVDRNVMQTNSTAHDYHPVNQGQVKWMCLQAAAEFLEKLPSDGNTNILNRIDSFPEGNNFRPANLGMIKEIALPFYARLIEEGYVPDYPWDGKTAKDYALANQGQLKNLFAFDLDAFDSDGDGLPDWWENKYGLVAAGEDDDNDGLTNLQEYQQGSDPQVSTYSAPSEENTPVGDESVNPPEGDLTEVLSVDGSMVVASVGTWVLDGSAIYAAGRRGCLTYSADLSTSDIYQLQLTIRQQSSSDGEEKDYRLRFEVDGEFVARRTVSVSDMELHTAILDTPFLDSGQHTVEVFWDNYENEISLRIEELAFWQYPGSDSDGSGMKDWVENRLMARNTIDVAPTESRTSPVCMEGLGLFTDAMQVRGADSVFHGADDRWFANAALASDGSDTDVSISFENGGRVLSRPVRWKETNLLAELLLDEIVVRRGDAMRLTAHLPNIVSGTSKIKVNGESVGSCSVDGEVVFRFEQDGVYVVEGSVSGVDGQGSTVNYSRTAQVRAVGSSSETVAAMVSTWRSWMAPSDRPSEAVAEWDSRLSWKTVSGVKKLKTTVPEERYGVVRLGENGPVIAPVTVKGFNLWFMKNTYLNYDEIYEDGSFTAKTTMIMSPVLSEIEINQRCRAVTSYEDGSRVRDFDWSDFSQTGEVVIIFSHSSSGAQSCCHYTDAYQDGVLVGRSY